MAGKYASMVIPLPMFKREGRPAMFSASAEQMNGFGCHCIYAFSFGNGLTGMSTKPHVHDFDEAIFCLGSDPNDISDLGATIEISIGREGEEQEIYSFDKPTVIVVPAGVYHTPMWTKDYRTPVLIMAVSLTDHYEARYD